MSAIQPTRPFVSIITPTYGREDFISAITDCVRAQTYEEIEWLVLDDSEHPSAELCNNSWNKLKYIHSTDRLSIGEKRNRLLDMASGDVILHFDDDDYYGCDYVMRAVQRLQKNQSDISLLSGFFAVHLDMGNIGFYRPLVKKGPAFSFSKKGIGLVELDKLHIPYVHLCYGWALAYRKSVWREFPFQPVTHGEDRAFLLDVGQKYRINFDNPEIVDCFHSVHSRSSTFCYPQFNLPAFVFRTLSPDAFQHFARLRNVVKRRNSGLPGF